MCILLTVQGGISFTQLPGLFSKMSGLLGDLGGALTSREGHGFSQLNDLPSVSYPLLRMGLFSKMPGLRGARGVALTTREGHGIPHLK